MKRLNLILLLAITALAASCGCTKPRELPETGGKFERYAQDLEMHSDILGIDFRFSILLPESYVKEKNKRYPVVFMLHGYGDNNNSWNGKYLQANARIKTLEDKGMSEMIYVYPNGFTTYYCNFYTGKYNYMDMFIKEFVPYIDKTYRTIADREHRALTGYSMGGFGAMVLAEKNPDVFSCSAPLSMSFRTDAQYMTESQNGWNGQWGAIFGGVGEWGPDRITEYYKQHCPYYQFVDENRSELSRVHWFFTCGDDEEQLLVANDSLHVLLRDRGFNHEFRVENGAHTSSYWMDALNEVLPYFDHYMNGGSLWPSYADVEKKEVNVSENGIVLSPGYVEGEPATGVVVAYNNFSAEQLADVYSVLCTTNTKAKFVYLPCDLSVKSLDEWMTQYSASYQLEKMISVSFGAAGEEIFKNRERFASNSFIDASINSEVVTAPGENYYFALTDEGKNYSDMGSLYRSCKRSGAGFEYRVINASGDEWEDTLRCIKKIQYFISY